MGGDSRPPPRLKIWRRRDSRGGSTPLSGTMFMLPRVATETDIADYDALIGVME